MSKNVPLSERGEANLDKIIRAVNGMCNTLTLSLRGSFTLDEYTPNDPFCDEVAIVVRCLPDVQDSEPMYFYRRVYSDYLESRMTAILRSITMEWADYYDMKDKT